MIQKSLTIFILFFNFIFAQNHDWQSITNMNDIQDIAVFNGEIIVATTGGAYIYTPENENTRRITNTDGLRSVIINEVEIDDYGNIIFGSRDGFIQQYNPVQNSWANIEFDGTDINDLKIFNDTMWVATGAAAAVFLYRNGLWEFSDAFYNFPQIVSIVNTIELYNAKVWLGTDIGLLSAPSNFNSFTLTDPQNWNLINHTDGLHNNFVLCLEVFNNRLWAGSAYGITILENNTIQDSIAFNGGVNFLLSKNGSLHIANNSRYYHSDGSAHNHTGNLPKRIQSINVGTDNVVWFGLETGGLRNNLNSKKILIDGPLKNQVRFIFKDKSGRIWASAGKFKLTRAEGYSFFENGIWTGHSFNGTGYYDIRNTDYFYEDRFNNIWFGTWGGGVQILNNGVYKYIHNHPHTGTRIVTTADTTYNEAIPAIEDVYKDLLDNAPNNLEDYVVTTAFKEDNAGNLWILNPYAGNGKYIAIAPYKNNFIDPEAAWTYFGLADGISLNEGGISSIEFDNFGRVWFGTHLTGIYILDYNNTLPNKSDDRLFKLDINDNLFSNSITSLAIDSDGIMWIATRAGLNSYDGANVYRHVGDENGFDGPVNSSINQIFVDIYNNKWIATGGGLSILRDGKSAFEPGSWISYTSGNSGLLNNLVHSVFVDSRSSEVLLGTESGISVFKGSFSEIQDNFNNVIGGPNPFNLSENSVFTIKMLKANSAVKIYNVNGSLVKNLTTDNSGVEGSRAFWDGKDLNGNTVPSGIYLYLAFTENGGATSGKIAVIRK
jgi:ligand-binding sensor domain-containing protein